MSTLNPAIQAVCSVAMAELDITSFTEYGPGLIIDKTSQLGDVIYVDRNLWKKTSGKGVLLHSKRKDNIALYNHTGDLRHYEDSHIAQAFLRKHFRPKTTKTRFHKTPKRYKLICVPQPVE